MATWAPSAPAVPWATRRGAGAGVGRAAVPAGRCRFTSARMERRRGARPAHSPRLFGRWPPPPPPPASQPCCCGGRMAPGSARSWTRAPRAPHPGAMAGGSHTGPEQSRGAGPAAEPPPYWPSSRGPTGRGMTQCSPPSPPSTLPSNVTQEVCAPRSRFPLAGGADGCSGRRNRSRLLWLGGSWSCRRQSSALNPGCVS